VGAGTAGCPGWGAYGDVVVGTAVVVAGLLDGAEALVEVSGPALRVYWDSRHPVESWVAGAS
jgi:hypothetical protein